MEERWDPTIALIVTVGLPPRRRRASGVLHSRAIVLSCAHASTQTVFAFASLASSCLSFGEQPIDFGQSKDTIPHPSTS